MSELKPCPFCRSETKNTHSMATMKIMVMRDMMMKIDKATPRPWRLRLVRWDHDAPTLGFTIQAIDREYNISKHGMSIASLGVAEPEMSAQAVYGSEVLEANAELIITAVNSYDPRKDVALRAAIEALRAVTPKCQHDRYDDEPYHQCGAMATHEASFGATYCDEHKAGREVPAGRRAKDAFNFASEVMGGSNRMSAAEICAEMARDAAMKAARNRSLALEDADEFALDAAAQYNAQADALHEAQKRTEAQSSDLVAIARDEVIEKARAWSVSRRKAMARYFMILPAIENELLAALSLLESREEIARQTEN